MDFTVWAPGRRRARVVVHGTEHEMTPTVGGWWSAAVPGAAAGSDYMFLLDAEATALPDPRSRWQPDGVHGPSRVYDHGAFGWTDQGWTGRALPGSVLYELHIGTFTPDGTFESAIERLDHLVELGIDLVEVMPVNAVDGPRNWGYDGVGWYAVTENYGGPDGFKRFVDACHARGLGVVLDVVHNHLGPSGAYLDRFGPYFAGRNIWGPSLNLDGPQSDGVRHYVIDNALEWLRDYHLDGLRLDAVHALRDTRATHLLEELATEVDVLATHLGRPLSLIAESDLNDPRLVTPRAAGGYGLAAQWDDDIHHCLHATLTGERQGYYGDFGSLSDLARTLRGVFFHDGRWSSFRQRTHGRPVDTRSLPGWKFLAYLQNHDQVGNRGTGDRISATLSPGLLACAAVLVLSSPYTPMIFMGEEWGARTPFQFFSFMPDAGLRDAIREGRYAEFAEHGWANAEVPDPNDEQTFLRSKLDWSEPLTEPHTTLLRTYRELIALRKRHPELADPRLDHLAVTVDEDQRTVVLHRGMLRVVVNLSAQAVPVRLDPGPGRMLLSSAAATPAPEGVLLAGESFAVLALDVTAPQAK
ncbi:MAG TPA: malto-oligosyltrehalose trehalohydrolase [Pseudonocardiaceae bacterium]|jgi:maltooligosyltrehalose trehalohydrolase|nr:malto-oligosyltrehalose trehalohydrolase [Pseudonocardiaceae bacterium]